MSQSKVMTVHELINKLLEIPIEHRNKEVYIEESNEYTYSSAKRVSSFTFTEDGMIDEEYDDTTSGESIRISVL